MQQREEKEKRLEELAQKVLNLSRNSLLVSYRFLDLALSMFEYVPGKGGIAVDGRHLFYDPVWVLEHYKEEKTVMTRNYFHMVLHCIFHHSFLKTDVEPSLWSLACDAAVENAIDELETRCTWAKRSVRQIAFLSELRKNVKSLTAEKIYRYLVSQNMTAFEADRIREDFRADEHDIWFTLQKQQVKIEAPEKEGVEERDSADESQAEEDGKEQDSADESQGKEDGKDGDSSEEMQAQDGGRSQQENEELWKDIAERMQTELETFAKEQGDQAGSLTQNLKAVTRERYDYADFLRRFSTFGETMKLSPDEFDYIFYSYGMKLYDNMPLIEPLESRETKKIREFVIAIDTSGSVSGELVQSFVRKTYNILKQQENFFSRINLHLIQCDAEIQEDAVITGPEEFEAYLKTMQLHGFGGTDFRPVFRYVEKLREEKAFVHLNGLIYFTDGYGTFPEVPPDYRTAFVFVEDEYNNPEVPVWAIKLVLPAEEIEER